MLFFFMHNNDIKDLKVEKKSFLNKIVIEKKQTYLFVINFVKVK